MPPKNNSQKGIAVSDGKRTVIVCIYESEELIYGVMQKGLRTYIEKPGTKLPASHFAFHPMPDPVKRKEYYDDFNETQAISLIEMWQKIIIAPEKSLLNFMPHAQILKPR